MNLPTTTTILLLALCLALVIPAAVSAETQTLVLVSGTGTQTAGYSLTDPSADPLNPALYAFGSWVPAALSTDIASTWYDPSTSPFGSGAAWVSSAATREGLNSEDQWRLFRQDIDLPAGATITSAQLAYTADNAVTVYLNGVEIAGTGSVYGAAPVPGPYYFSSAYNIDLAPVDGSDTLLFVVRNWQNNSNNPSGLLYKATIEYTVEEPVPAPEFPSAFLPATMIIGLLGAVLFIQRTKEN